MLQWFKQAMGLEAEPNFRELIQSGAQIVDVRTPGEYQGGHIRGSLNLPLQSLSSGLSKLKKDQPVITCCASGMRSASAKSLLKAQGFQVYNGGGWLGLQSKIGK